MESGVLENLVRKLQQEVRYKEQCDAGELVSRDDWGEEYLVSYYPDNWQSVIEDLLTQTGNNTEELTNILEQFTQGIEKGTLEEFVSSKFVSELSRNIKRITLENAVTRDDIVEYASKLSKKELASIFGKEIAQMKGFEQKNVHHCYDLLGHTLHTIAGISRDGLTDEQFKKLRISALFHDVGKPDVSQFNEKTGQQVFYGHAGRSMEIAGDILSELGYDKQDVDEMQFYIGHHDDFISYKSKTAEWMKNHEFIRGTSPETVAEKMLENEFDFAKMGYDKDQIRYICYALAHNQNPEFLMQGKPVHIDIDMNEVQRKMQMASKYRDKPKFTLDNYKMLLRLCRADANAQAEVVMQNGKKISSRAEKVENFDKIEEASERAMEILESNQMSSKILGTIIEETEDEIRQDYLEDLYYEGYQDPITDLEIGRRFDDKSPAFMKELKERIIKNQPKKFEGIEEDYNIDIYGDEEAFEEVFTRHLAEALVDIEDISNSKNNNRTPLQQREEKLSKLEREKRVIEETERLIALKENENTIDNE